MTTDWRGGGRGYWCEVGHLFIESSARNEHVSKCSRQSVQIESVDSTGWDAQLLILRQWVTERVTVHRTDWGGGSQADIKDRHGRPDHPGGVRGRAGGALDSKDAIEVWVGISAK